MGLVCYIINRRVLAEGRLNWHYARFFDTYLGLMLAYVSPILT